MDLSALGAIGQKQSFPPEVQLHSFSLVIPDFKGPGIRLALLVTAPKKR